jgi:hypothetical protein
MDQRSDARNEKNEADRELIKQKTRIYIEISDVDPREELLTNGAFLRWAIEH